MNDRNILGTCNSEIANCTVVGRGSSNLTTANAVKQKSEHHLRTPPQHLVKGGVGQKKEDRNYGRSREAKLYSHQFNSSGRMSKSSTHKYNADAEKGIRTKRDHHPKHFGVSRKHLPGIIAKGYHHNPGTGSGVYQSTGRRILGKKGGEPRKEGPYYQDGLRRKWKPKAHHPEDHSSKY